MSDNEVEDVSFLAGPGQGGTGKRAVYEPTGSQRCKQVVCSKSRAVAIVSLFVILVLTIALIGSFARIVETPICVGNSADSDSSGLANNSAQNGSGNGPPMATNGDRFPWEIIRLPSFIRPTGYHIFLHPNLTTFTFNGTTTITVSVIRNTQFIVLHVKNLNVSQVSVREAEGPSTTDGGSTSPGATVTVSKTLECVAFEMLHIQVASVLRAGSSYIVTIHYSADISRQLVGFYRSSYLTKSGERRWLLTTHFQPTDARAAFPCFDEPEYKASFKLSMIREAGYKSLFNMPIEESKPYGLPSQGLTRDNFVTSVNMSTYLVAFVVCDFDFKQNTTAKGTLVSVYAPPDQINQTLFALQTATSVLEYFEEFFGIAYPLKKQDLIAIPDFAAGAMENWGLITYRLTTILYDPLVSSASNQQHVAIVVAHELAHQWFGNLVTMEWWNDLWLNEGFASFVEYLGVNHIKPEWKMMDQFFVDTMQTALSLDSLTSSHPVSVTVNDPTEINEIFDSISYDKGASLIQMLEGFIGHDALQRGLKDYLDTFKFGNAKTDDLWNSLSEQVSSDLNVKTVMDTWTLQMGYPVVKISKSGNRITATQERFLLNPKANTTGQSSVYNYTWHIPLTYITNPPEGTTPDQNPSTLKWMNRGDVRFDVPSDMRWIKCNVNQKGLYRVHYSEENWRALIQQLRDNHMVFSAADRAGLIEDAFALSRAGILNVSVALDLSDYLEHETDYVPWVTALSNLAYVGKLLEDKASYENFSKYLKSRILHMVVQLGWEDEGNVLDKYLRAYMLSKAIKLNHESTVTKAKQLFDDWLHDDVGVSPNLKNVVYRAGIHHSSDAEWEMVYQKYNNSLIPSEKVKLMVALAATRDGARLLRYLDMALDESKVRKGDTVSVVTSIANTAAGQILAWRKVKQHWDVYMKRYGRGSFDMSQLIQGLTAGFDTQFDFDEVSTFFDHHKSGSGYRAVSQALEHIQMNADYMVKNLQTVESWLSDKVATLPDDL